MLDPKRHLYAGLRHMEKSLVRTLAFVLVDQFALMSYAALIEPFRAANALAGQAHYAWHHLTLDDRPVSASNGATIMPDVKFETPMAADVIFILAAGDMRDFSAPGFLSWLRKKARSGTMLAGISAGPHILARAGLLDGYKATIHWDHRDDFEDRFPSVIHQEGLYVIDRSRVTCAGGMASMDLAVDLISRDLGHAMAARIGDWFIRPEARSADRPQRGRTKLRYGITNDRVLKALAHMEEHIEEPVRRTELARLAGVTVRQLERLFVQELDITIAGQYLAMRLDKATHLLRSTSHSTTLIALMCGFKSCSHFSRAFKRRFGVSPRLKRNL